MLAMTGAGITAGILLGAAPVPSPAIAALSALPFWTLEDLVLAPEVTEIELSQDNRSALYAVRASDMDAGRPRTTVRLVDIKRKIQRDLFHADAAKLIRRIPGKKDWSALIDFGEGLQLYRIDPRGMVTSLIINSAPVRVGKADMSLLIGGDSPPRSVGVLAYDCSPDGKWLWYSLLKAKPGPSSVRFDREVTALRDRRRSQIDAQIEFYLRAPDGTSRRVAVRPSSDRLALHGGGNVIWTPGKIQFRIENADGSAGSTQEIWEWDLAGGKMRTLASERDAQTLWLLRGPRGGKLEMAGVGKRLNLGEISADKARHSYGRFGFTIGDPRSAGFSRSADGRKAVLGTRYIERPRYGLAVLDHDGVREISSSASVTKCGFDDSLSSAICVEEGLTLAPELVEIDLATGVRTPILKVSPHHSAIAPLDVRARTWINRLGYKATGYVVRPRGYREGVRYPAIIVTHGSDADERFAEGANQWNYPVQVFAERGYVVLLINDPAPRQSAELQAAYSAWSRGSGPPGPAEVQRLVWINGVYSFEDAVRELAAEGLIDPLRVGLAGYSRGSQLVNVAVTQSGMFRAASSGDGGFLEPAGYSLSPASYGAIFGGSPYGEYGANYRRFSPSLNADKVCAPVLQQVASASRSQADLYDALRKANVPAQISLYPGASPASDETHLFHRPTNRMLAMRENIAWFDYWLLGKRDPDAPFPGRFAAWDRMAEEAADRCRIR